MSFSAGPSTRLLLLHYLRTLAVPCLLVCVLVDDDVPVCGLCSLCVVTWVCECRKK